MNLDSLKKAHLRLIDKLDLKEYLMAHRRYKPNFVITEDYWDTEYDLPSKEVLQLMFLVEEFRLQVDKSFEFLNNLFVSTISYDLLLKIRHQNDERLVKAIEVQAVNVWQKLNEDYEKLRKNIETYNEETTIN